MIELPQTDFYRMRDQVFLKIGGRFLNIGNSEIIEHNYLTLEHLTFPISMGTKLTDNERNYFKKNKEIISKLQIEIENEVKRGNGIESLKRDLELSQDIHFFLTEICARHNPELKIRNTKKMPELTNESIKPFFPCKEYLGEILKEDYLIIIGRVYPLRKSDRPEYVDFKKNFYTIVNSKMTLDDVEELFKQKLREEITSFVISNSDASRRIMQKINELKTNIEALVEDLQVSIYEYCYECGDIGFDTKIRSVYWLIPKHKNYTSKRKYNYGESAVSLPFINGNLGISSNFVQRNDRNSPFEFHPHSNCYGFSFQGKSLDDKMHYLRTCASVVYRNNRFSQR